MKMGFIGASGIMLDKRDVRWLDTLGITEVLVRDAHKNRKNLGIRFEPSVERWAESKGIPVRVFRVHWDKYGEGEEEKQKAITFRNNVMIKHADAFVVYPGGLKVQEFAAMIEDAGLEAFLPPMWERVKDVEKVS